MKVEELIIDGFKSYATRTVIAGWDPQFNAITGLNGSGKSNILDAICFVLGISSMTTVRASNLQDLIYKRGQAGVTKASVTIVFDNSDSSKSPIGFESIPKISVTRQIVLGGTSKYLINGHRAQQQAVLQLFQSVQLNINNPNFLIMQGKITKVLNMKALEILSLIEEAAGTKMFEDRKDKAEKTMSKKETKLQEIRSLLIEEIEPKLEKLRNEKRMFIEFQQVQSDLENLKRVVNAHEFVRLSNNYNKYSNEFQSKKQFMESSEVEISKLNDEISKLNEDLSRVKRTKQESLSKDNKLSKLEAKQDEISKKITRLNTSLSINKENLNDEENKKLNIIESIEDNEQLLNKNLNSFKDFENNYNLIENEINELKAYINKREELLSSLTTGVSLKNNGSSNAGFNAQLTEERSKLSECQVKIEQSKLKIDHFKKENKSNEAKLAEAQKDYNKSQVELTNLKNKKLELEDKLKNFGFDLNNFKNLTNLEIDLQKEIHQLSNELNYLKRQVGNLEFQYSKPYPNFDTNSVKGIVAQLFTLSDENMDSATALEITAGGRLYNVVVDNEIIGSQLLEKGQLRRRVTIIPLNKISSRVLPKQTVDLAKQLCPDKVELALNLIGYESEIAKAMEFIFGQRFICKDSETAKKITFNPQIRARSITLQGDVYDPEGTLSGGSRKQNSSILINIQNYNKLNSKLKNLNNELNRVKMEITKNNEISNKTKNLQKDINNINNQIHLFEKNLNSNSSFKMLEKQKNNLNEISINEEIIQNELVNKSKIEQEIGKIEKDIKEFKDNKGSKLNELENEIKEKNATLSKLVNKLEKMQEAFSNSKIEIDQLQLEINNLKESLNESNVTIEDLKDSINNKILKELEALNSELGYVNNDIEIEKSKEFGIIEEIKELSSIITDKTNKLNDIKLKILKNSNDFENLENSIKSINQKREHLLSENSWLSDENIVNNIISNNQNILIEEYNERIQRLNENFIKMKRKVNSNIMNMIDNVEKKENSLKQMIKTIEKDKAKIEETIVTLNEYKRETLIKTWEKVNRDFGQIFEDLLPNSFAKLVAVNENDITAGIEIKVRLGKIWKDSLVELSGGQRSLIALSLILALLQFKPAPMYILDEVDAALDLSHTQNIGHLIKTRFKSSQFIIVSLKEGMFTNANRIFKTRFQDGTSVVSVL